MFDDLLPQICQIVRETPGGTQWDPEQDKRTVLIDNVPCRFDPLLLTRHALGASTDVNIAGRSGGVVFIGSGYGVGSHRKFNEQDYLRLYGDTDFEIKNINDIWGSDELHHYEVEVTRGINR